MNANTRPLEEDTRVLINNALTNLGWKLKGKDKNVFFEQPKTESERRELGGKRPDFVLYSKESDKPLIVIEAKRKGSRIDLALEQGIGYARAINAPLVFATDGVFCRAFHTAANRPPILNGEEVDEFIRESLALRYLTTYEVNTVSPKVQYDRKELIRIFDEANNMLRGDGLRAGIERFGEFANILFLKLISENEQIKRESGEKSKFDIASCSWDSIKNIAPSARIEYINNTVYKRLNALYQTEIFTPLTIRDETILKEIMDKLDPLMLTDVDSDVKGDAFEYFLKASTSTKNDLGEYFTPRHIVKTMVRLVNPQIGEKIYDPFCGTGGFLIESFRHIYNNMARTDVNLQTLREHTVYGNEITNTARITKMNMILAGDGHSNIQMLDSLANPIDGTEIYMDETGAVHHRGFDIVLANMPYSQKTKHGALYDLPSKNGDSICVQHCMKAINSASENGRMALVVPEGFLFRKDLAKTREYLLDHCQLQSIISLPQGVFLPYTGVKTDIIYATEVNKKIKASKKRKDYWYFDVKSDGYTLDNHRRKLDTQSDLTRYEEYRKLDNDQVEDMLKVGFEVISLDKVRENSFVLVGSRYREAETLVSEFNSVKLSDIASFDRGLSFPKSAQSIGENDESIGIITTKAAQADGLDFSNIVYVDRSYIKKETFVNQGDILISLANSLDLVGRVTYVDKNYDSLSFGAFMGRIRPNIAKVYPEYLFSILQSKKAKDYFKSVAKTTTNISNLTFEDLGNFVLPLPSLEQQYKIIEEIEEYRKIISGATQVLSNYVPHLKVSKDSKVVKLLDVCAINEHSVNPEVEYGENNFTYIDISSVESGTGKIDKSHMVKGVDAPSRARRHFDRGDILLSTVRPNLKAFSYIDFDTNGFIASTGFAVLSPKNINGKYLYYMLMDDYVANQLNSAMSKAMYPSVNRADLEDLNILCPTAEEQAKIVNQIEKEFALISPIKEIISMFNAKIKSRIEEVWGE